MFTGVCLGRFECDFDLFRLGIGDESIAVDETEMFVNIVLFVIVIIVFFREIR